jgi:hypothetical protein
LRQGAPIASPSLPIAPLRSGIVRGCVRLTQIVEEPVLSCGDPLARLLLGRSAGSDAVPLTGEASSERLASLLRRLNASDLVLGRCDADRPRRLRRRLEIVDEAL